MPAACCCSNKLSRYVPSAVTCKACQPSERQASPPHLLTLHPSCALRALRRRRHNLRKRNRKNLQTSQHLFMSKGCLFSCNTRIQQKLVAGPTLGPAHQKQLPKPACSTDHLGKLKLSCCSSHSGIDGTAAQRQLCSMHCSTTAQHNRQKGTTRRLQWKIWGGSHHPKTPQPRPALLTHHSAKRDAGATATQDSVQATRHAASQAHAPACVTSAASGQAKSCA